MKKSVLAIALAVLMAVSLLTVGAMAEDDVVAAVTDSTGVTTDYQSLQVAFDSAQDGSVIKIVKDFSTGDRIWISNDRNLTLDLNGKTVTSTITQQFINVKNVNAKLTVIDSSYDNSGRIVAVGNMAFFVYGGTLDIQSGTIESRCYWNSNGTLFGDFCVLLYGSTDSNATDYTNFTLGSEARIVFIDETSDGTPIGNGYAVVVDQYQDGANKNLEAAYGVNVDIYGSTEHSILYVQGNVKKTGENAPQFILHDGAYIDGGIYAAGYAKWLIDGATVIGSTGMEIRAGELIVNDGSIITGTGTPTEVQPNGNGSTTDGVGLAIAQHTTKLPLNIVINGGEINGFTAFYQSNPQNNDQESIDKVNITISGGDFTAINGGTNSVYSENKTGFINGGSFSSPVVEYVASDLNYELNNNGTYSYYATAEEALADAEPGAKINGLGAAPATNYTITVVYGNGMYPSEYTVPAGTEYTLPNVTNSGYIFLGWRSGDNTYKAGEKVAITADTTFTAVWGNLPDVKPSEPETPDTPVFPFYDVTARDWYYSAVKYVYEKGLMDGVDVGVFEPNANMTRAMVWAILARIDGETVTGAAWATDARAWAMAEGVSDGTDPNGLVTREQLATMLWRYAGEPDSDYSLSAFTDAGSVSDYAETAMAWAVEHSIITGMTDTTIVPQGTATRAQCAAMLMRFVEGDF